MTRFSSTVVKHLVKSVAVAALVAGLGTTSALAAYQPPAKPLSIEDVARYDALGSLSLAPDGNHSKSPICRYR